MGSDPRELVSVPPRPMQCSTVASLRATATLARRMPERSAMAVPQASREDQRLVQVNRMFVVLWSASVGGPVALHADAAGAVRLARLVAPRRQAEAHTGRATAAEPGRVIDSRAEGPLADSADLQPEPAEQAVDAVVAVPHLAHERLPGRQECL